MTSFLSINTDSLVLFFLDEEEEDDVVAPKPLVEPEEVKTFKKEEEEEGTVQLSILHCEEEYLIRFNLSTELKLNWETL